MSKHSICVFVSALLLVTMRITSHAGDTAQLPYATDQLTIKFKSQSQEDAKQEFMAKLNPHV